MIEQRGKPDIVSVIRSYGIDLRRRGKEFFCLCPLHAEKTPSFAVNADKRVFYCHGCHEGGDLIDFVMKFKGLNYREAIAELGMTAGSRSKRRRPQALLGEARRLAGWANTMTASAEGLLRDIGQRARICSLAKREPSADKKLIAEYEAGLTRQWAILSDVADDLQDSRYVLELYRQRDFIENLVTDAIVENGSGVVPADTGGQRTFSSPLMSMISLNSDHGESRDGGFQ